MLKVLKATRNDYPQFYAEYRIEDIGVFMDKLPVAFLPVIKADIEQRGMVHPIIVFSPYEQYQSDPNPALPEDEKTRKEILRVYMGHKRIWVARELGYTHISAYHVRRDKDARILSERTRIADFCPN
jgi:hypothetical protein